MVLFVLHRRVQVCEKSNHFEINFKEEPCRNKVVELEQVRVSSPISDRWSPLNQREPQGQRLELSSTVLLACNYWIRYSTSGSPPLRTMAMTPVSPDSESYSRKSLFRIK